MKSLLLTAALLAASWSLAQAQPGSGGPVPGAVTPVTTTPVDGGASLLLAGGIGYAVRRLRQRRAK